MNSYTISYKLQTEDAETLMVEKAADMTELLRIKRNVVRRKGFVAGSLMVTEADAAPVTGDDEDAAEVATDERIAESRMEATDEHLYVQTPEEAEVLAGIEAQMQAMETNEKPVETNEKPVETNEKPVETTSEPVEYDAADMGGAFQKPAKPAKKTAKPADRKIRPGTYREFDSVEEAEAALGYKIIGINVLGAAYKAMPSYSSSKFIRAIGGDRLAGTPRSAEWTPVMIRRMRYLAATCVDDLVNL